jgi:uncharacterized membrane protein YkoI
MKNRLALSISAVVTLFVLVIGSGVALYLSRNFLANASASSITTASTVQADPVSTQPSVEQQIQSLIDAREAAYRQALDDANSKLQQANAQLEQAYNIIKSLKQTTGPALAPTPAPTATAALAPQPTPIVQPVQTDQAAQPGPGYAVSADQAAAIALSIEPSGQLLRTPDLVSFQGTTAYEVQLDLGTVYVDANSGNVLYDGAAPAPPSIPNPQNHVQQENEGDEGNG